MITIEIDSKTEEVFIHAEPADLRGLAKKLWEISEKAETKGKHKEQYTSKADSEVEIASKPRRDSRKNSVIKKITISSSEGSDT